MASSTSVASLVITMETGLSDEEAPLEPCHLVEKSWVELKQTETRCEPLMTVTGFLSLDSNQPGWTPGWCSGSEFNKCWIWSGLSRKWPILFGPGVIHCTLDRTCLLSTQATFLLKIVMGSNLKQPVIHPSKVDVILYGWIWHLDTGESPGCCHCYLWVDISQGLWIWKDTERLQYYSLTTCSILFLLFVSV